MIDLRLYVLHLKKYGISANVSDVQHIFDTKKDVFFFFKKDTSVLVYGENDTLYFWAAVINTIDDEYKRMVGSYMRGHKYNQCQYLNQKRRREVKNVKPELVNRLVLHL